MTGWMMAATPARSRALRLYQTAIPLRLRLALRRRLSPELRSALARRLVQGGVIARAVDRGVTGTTRLRNRALLVAGDHAVVRREGGAVLARVHPAVSPTLVRRETLDYVLATLAGAGIPTFCVRGFNEQISAVAVPAARRQAVADAFAAACATTPGYVARLLGGQPEQLRLASRPAARRRAFGGGVVRFVRFFADPTGALVLGPDNGCDIEFWSEVDGELIAPRPNRVADNVAVAGETVPAPESVFVRTVQPNDTRTLPTRPELLGELVDDITFPIDVVYTWVDGSDPAWRARRDRALGVHAADLNAHAANESRYISRDELRYSLRSLDQFAPWVNHIWLVTDDQVPRWLDSAHERITVVSHRELFAGRGTLPTFNSHAIESQLHHIDGLAEHFIYFNDDVLIGCPVRPHAFFNPNGVTKFFPSTAKIDPAPASVVDAPVTAAGKNNRRLVLKEFGRRVTYKMKHCPHALRRSVLAEVEGRFEAELEATAHHQFRHPEDISLVSSLYHYYAHITGRAVVGDLRYMYTNLADRDTPGRLRLMLARRDFDVLCLNDTDSDPSAVQRQQRMLDEFLTSYYPVPAPWEIPDR